MIFSVALSPSLDVTYSVDDLRLGRIHRPTEVFRMAGGKALNAARAAATLGADVAAVALLGGSAGDTIALGLTRAGVCLSRVESATPTRTCISIHSRAGGKLTEIYESAVDVSLPELAEVFAAVNRMLDGRSGWLIVSGGMPASLSPDVLPELFNLAQARGIRVAVDTHGDALGRVVDARPDLVKVNRAEASAQIDGTDDTPIAELALVLQRRTGGLVVITDGIDGAVASDGSAMIRARLRSPLGQFAVGSGDSFLGGLVVGLDGGASIAEAMRVAAACGTANALVPGAARFDRATVNALVRTVEIVTEWPTQASSAECTYSPRA